MQHFSFEKISERAHKVLDRITGSVREVVATFVDFKGSPVTHQTLHLHPPIMAGPEGQMTNSD